LRIRATPAQLGPLTVKVPDHTDLLLHTLAHGKLPDLRWLVDAAFLINTNPAKICALIDFERLASTASQRRYLTRVTRNTMIMERILPGDGVERLKLALAHQPCLFGDSTNVEYGTGRLSARAKAAAVVTFNQVRDRSPAEAIRFLTGYPMYLSHVGSYSDVIRKLHPKNRHASA
jgi:hypothetical protein